MDQSRLASRRRKKRPWLRLLALLLVAALAVVGWYGWQVWSAVDKAYQPPNREKSDKRSAGVDITDDPVSILLLGVDERKTDRGRSDTIMVMTVNPKQKTVKLTNIPRDTYVTLPGRGKDKINHAYAYGGTEMTMRAVEEFLDIPVDYVSKVNMQGFQAIIDELGGVEVDVPFDFDYEGHRYRKGTMTLDGEEALRFAQMRKADPRGDLGRNERQQQVIKGILKKGTSLSSITKLDDVMGHVGENVVTDIAPLDLIKLQAIYRQLDRNDVQTIRIEGHNQRIGGIFYYVVPEGERLRVSKVLKEHLELEGSGG